MGMKTDTRHSSPCSARSWLSMVGALSRCTYLTRRATTTTKTATGTRAFFCMDLRGVLQACEHTASLRRVSLGCSIVGVEEAGWVASAARPGMRLCFDAIELSSPESVRFVAAAFRPGVVWRATLQIDGSDAPNAWSQPQLCAVMRALCECADAPFVEDNAHPEDAEEAMQEQLDAAAFDPKIFDVCVLSAPSTNLSSSLLNADMFLSGTGAEKTRPADVPSTLFWTRALATRAT